MTWKTDNRKPGRGTWKCRLKDAEQHRARYASDAVYRLSKTMHDSYFKRRKRLDQRILDFYKED